jgi:pyruvate/2-oxoglutarate/acetoin dehydrogenase E1 component
MVAEALEAAATLERDGTSVEVIDLRSLAPLDLGTVASSVEKTNRLVVAHEAVLQGGLGAEIAASIQQSSFDALDAPIERVGAAHSPVPASPELEAAYVPGRREIVAAVERTLGR